VNTKKRKRIYDEEEDEDENDFLFFLFVFVLLRSTQSVSRRILKISFTRLLFSKDESME